MKRNGGTMPDRLHSLVETIIGSFPVEDPHAQYVIVMTFWYVLSERT